MAKIVKSSNEQLKELQQAVEDLEARVNETQRRYEMYFAGVDRAEPRYLRDDCKRRIAELNRVHFTNIGARYRFESCKARLTTFENYWNRTMRQIEEGTYRRHKFMADRHMRERDALAAAKAANAEAGADSALAQQHAMHRLNTESDAVIAKRERLARGGTAATVTGADLDDQSVQRVYRALLKVKEAAGDQSPTATVDQLARGLRATLPQLRAKYGDKPLDIKIVNREGKVMVKATPRDET
jgi:hypothetical protein